MHTIRESDIRKLISLKIDLYSLLLLSEEHHLKPREKEVYIEHIVLDVQGININSPGAINKIVEKLNFSCPNDVWQYRQKLHKKGWFIKHGQRATARFEIIPNFNYRIREFKELQSYSFNVQYVGTYDLFKEDILINKVVNEQTT